MALEILFPPKKEWGIRLDRAFIFRQYLKDRRKALWAFGIFVLCFFFLYFLYDVRMEPAFYTLFLMVLFSSPFIVQDIRRYYKVTSKMMEITHSKFTDDFELPHASGLIEQCYQAEIQKIIQAWKEDRALQRAAATERDDYYTLWTHQIKTPLYSMDLMLQTHDMAPQKWRIELMKVSQYVEMALKYLQLENQSADVCLSQVHVVSLVQEAVKKYSGMFIAKKLCVELKDLNGFILTDQKWFSFMLEQLISNAVKYTDHGGVTIYQSAPTVICISDTGIGISDTDLPLIFEKGYSGFNGRIQQKSSGCGLYLCRKIATLLGCSLSVTSKLNCGTTVAITLPQFDFPVVDN